MKNNLINELFDKSKNFRMAILCTYSLSIDFLEKYLLNLDGLAQCEELSIFTDRRVYNKLFESSSLQKSKWINKRYLLTPIDTNGVFHPKLYILASDKMIRIGIGSSNLTREGLASNLELASVFEITKKDKMYLGLLLECLDFLKGLAENSDSKSAIDRVKNFNNYVSDFLGGESEKNMHLLHNLNQTISSQVASLLEDKIVTKVEILSPFFDKELKALKWLKGFLKDIPFHIFIQQGKTNFPVAIYKNESKNTKIYVYDKCERYIHGKVIIFTTNQGIYGLAGSANFTESALLSANYSKNIETSLWGIVEKEVAKRLIKPNGHEPILLRDIKNLVINEIQTEEERQDSWIVLDWLIEVVAKENQVSVILKDKERYIPKKLFFNGDEKKSFDYAENIEVVGLNKSEMYYAQVSGINPNGLSVKSGKIWVVNLSSENEIYNRKRYSVNSPSQLMEIIKDLTENGTEEELIDYLMKFNIPLDLSISRRGINGLNPKESKGNIFGVIGSQNSKMLNDPNLPEALRHFFDQNLNKLAKHRDNAQVLKLDNFILIFSSMFGMMNVIHDSIIINNKKRGIKAKRWSTMRYLYDIFLEYSEKSLELLWISNEEFFSYAEMIDIEFEKDTQNILGNIKSFKEYLIKTGNDYYLFECCKIIKKIYQCLNIYIEKGKVITETGEIKLLPISSYGSKDTYILKRNKIHDYAVKLEKDLTSYKFKREET